MSPTNRKYENVSPVIFGCIGQKLSVEEYNFFSDIKPLGFILFSRNISNPDQLYKLVSDLRGCVSHKAFILVDQEGGRIQRLCPPFWRQSPSMLTFGKKFVLEPEMTLGKLYDNMTLVGLELSEMGIDVNCAPCLDILFPGADEIIGDRAFSDIKDIIASLAQVACDALIDTGVVPVIKHIPGHGRANIDSHKALPVVNESIGILSETDWYPFKVLSKNPVAAMTAHIVYSELDLDNSATHSKTIIKEIIREQIGFKGLLISDDIGMNALNGNFNERAIACLHAGCDVVLHCSGEMIEMRQVASSLDSISYEAEKSIEKLDIYRGSCVPEINKLELTTELNKFLGVISG